MELINLANIKQADIIVEIGPGKGIITRQLARVCSQVIAVEYDTDLYNNLVQDFRSINNVAIHHGDFLAFDLSSRKFKIFASIPFNITSAIVAHITNSIHQPTDAYLIMQKEAAKKYLGLPYSTESLKSLLIKPRFELSIIHNFRSTDFSPAPSVRVVFVHLHKRPAPLLMDNDYRRYKDFLCYVFSQRGKTIGERTRSIFTKTQLRRLGDQLRFSTAAGLIDLSFDQWLSIFSCYSERVSPEKQKLVKGAYIKLKRQQDRLEKIHRSRTGRRSGRTHQ